MHTTVYAFVCTWRLVFVIPIRIYPLNHVPSWTNSRDLRNGAYVVTASVAVPLQILNV